MEAGSAIQRFKASAGRTDVLLYNLVPCWSLCFAVIVYAILRRELNPRLQEPVDPLSAVGLE
jgi:hypothetical protein